MALEHLSRCYSKPFSAVTKQLRGTPATNTPPLWHHRDCPKGRAGFWPGDYGRVSRCRPSSVRTLVFFGQQPGFRVSTNQYTLTARTLLASFHGPHPFEKNHIKPGSAAVADNETPLSGPRLKTQGQAYGSHLASGRCLIHRIDVLPSRFQKHSRDTMCSSVLILD